MQGNRVEIDLKQSINTDTLGENVYPFGSPAPLNQNTGIERDGGVANLYSLETDYSETGEHFITEGGEKIAVVDRGDGYSNVLIDGVNIGAIQNYGVNKRIDLAEYDDYCLTSDNKILGASINAGVVTLVELDDAGAITNTRSTTFPNIAAMDRLYTSFSIIRKNGQTFANTTKYGLRIGSALIFLDESDPSAAYLNILREGTQKITDTIRQGVLYKNDTLILAGNQGRVYSFDGNDWKNYDGTGRGTGPYGILFGGLAVAAVCQYKEFLIFVCTDGKISSFDGLNWKYHDGTGTGIGPYNSSVMTQALGMLEVTSKGWLIIYGTSGNISSFDGTNWKLYNGTGTGSAPYKAGFLGSVNIECGKWLNGDYSNTIVFAGGSGRLGSYIADSSTWVDYNAGSGIFKGTFFGGASVTACEYGGAVFVAGSADSKVSSYDSNGWKYHDGTGTGTGPYSSDLFFYMIGIIKWYQNSFVFCSYNDGGARISSWTNPGGFKNYNGTGTGTGIYGNVPPNFRIQYFIETQYGTYFGGYKSGVQFYAGSVNYAKRICERQTIILNGAAITNQLFLDPISLTTSSIKSASYLYLYQYETGVDYFCNIVGNELDRSYSINRPDDSSVSGYFGFGKYAVLQVKNGKSRHVLTGPAFYNAGSTDLLVSGLRGYNDFNTYSGLISTTYIKAPANISSVDGTISGFGYGEGRFKTAASASDVNHYLIPSFYVQPQSWFEYRKQNTNTFSNVYGKLTNLYEVAPSEPFEIRVIMVNGFMSALSAAILDDGGKDCLGVLLTNVGEFDDTFQPQVIGPNILYKYNGVFRIIRLSTSPDRIQKISRNLYKLNTISAHNIIDTESKTLELGSIDYNGRMVFNSSATADTSSAKVASVIVGKHSASIDTGEKLVQIPTMTSTNWEVIGYRIPNISQVLQGYAVDTFYGATSTVYQASTLNDGSELVDSNKVNTIYVPDTRIPPAIGYEYQGGGLRAGGKTIFLQDAYDGYNVGSETDGVYDIFKLFGQTYLFDGAQIYIVDLTGNTFNSKYPVAQGGGLFFLASSPTTAFFASSFDNSIYSFDGGRALNKFKRMSQMPTIQKGVFNVKENTMLLETASSLIWVRDNIITENLKTSDMTNLKLYDTENGIFFANNLTFWQYGYKPVGTVLPLIVKTAYFGQDSNQKSITNAFNLTLFNRGDSEINVKATVYGFNEANSFEKTSVFRLKRADFNDFGYARVRIQPIVQRSLGTALKLEIAEKVTVIDLCAVFNDDVQGLQAGGRSK